MEAPAKKSWPPPYLPEVNRRYKLNRRIRQTRTRQIAAEKWYASHPIEWINDWCVTYDPRLKGVKKIPFVLFQKQVDFINYLVELWKSDESGLVEKCRDIGATWLCCAFSVWLWKYHAGTAIGWGSRKADYVDDKNNPKAIFPKIRQILENLPKWQIPAGFDPRFHASKMKIINPVNGSTITGEGGDGIGRGGRTTIYFVDEAAHVEHPETIEASLGDNTNVRVDISSVNGSANIFYHRRMAGTVWEKGKEIESGVTRVFIFDWRDHPAKTQEWYDKRRKKAESEGLLHIFAQEVDRDYAGAVVGVIIKGEWVRACIDAHKKLAHLGDWFAGDNIAGQDIADGGKDRNACVGCKGSVVVLAKHWGGEAGDAARIAVPLCAENGINSIYYDCIGVGAGFKTEINRMKKEEGWPKHMKIFKWDASAPPLDPEDNIVQGDEETPTNEEHYENLKAQGWFRLRSQVYKTYRAITFGEEYGIAEMISLSSELELLHELVAELSQPVAKPSLKTGKTVVDKKPDGSFSPNLADACMQARNPCLELSIFDVL